MATINPYLNFDGNAEAAFNFYKSVFGGEFITFQLLKNAPDGDKLSVEEQNRVMHVSLPISEGFVLMGSDIVPSMGHKLIKGNNSYISLNTKTKEETERLFNALSEGGTIQMPLAMTFWGSYFGMFADKFGTQWMVSQQHDKQG